MQPVVLDTVTLRPLTANDLGAFNAIYTDPDVRKYAEEPATRPLSRLFLLVQRPALELLVIENTATGEIIGWCGLSDVPRTPRPTYEPEIFLKSSGQKQGVGAQVLNELVLIASRLNHQVQTRIHVENAASQGLMKKLNWSVMDRSGEWEVWVPPTSALDG